VVGQTGSGKSSLLGAALGLMKQVQGPPVEVHGKVRPGLAQGSMLGTLDLSI
jgi:ABC-type Mn2+/Zn2+ transport system ATPase subunit